MSNAVLVCRLIAEIKKRPALWDMQHADYNARQYVVRLWNEVSKNVGIHVVQCKRKWKNLRDAYRLEVKRSIRRIERDKLMGVYDPNTKYNSQWVYFPAMSFISDIKQDDSTNILNGSTSCNSNDLHDMNFDSVDDDLNSGSDHDLFFEQLHCIETPPAAELSINKTSDQIPNNKHVNVNASTTNARSCNCTSRSNDGVNFLKQRRRLTTSTGQDRLGHVGDSDYNFLVSFLPQMKKLSDLQNLKFRAKMSETVLNILTPAVTEDSHSNATGNQSLTTLHTITQ